MTSQSSSANCARHCRTTGCYYDHVTHTPGNPAAINRTGVLRGKAGCPIAEGFLRTIHYEISGAGRIDCQFNDTYTGGTAGDPHPVVFTFVDQPLESLAA